MNRDEEPTPRRPNDHLVEPLFAGLGHEEEPEPEESPSPGMWRRVWRLITGQERSDR